MSINKEAMLAVADVIEYADRLAMATYAAETKITKKVERANRKALRTGVWTEWHKALEEVKPQEELVPTIWDNCETTGCIAGWTLAWADIDPRGDDGIGQFDAPAAKELGLTRGQAFNLFVSSDWWRHQGFKDFGKITAKQAAGVLRKIAAGEIDLPDYYA